MQFLNRRAERKGGLGRALVLAFSLFLAGSAAADWLFWTVDFTYDWENEGEMQANPWSSSADSYVWLCAETETAGGVKEKIYLSDQIQLTDDSIWGITQADLSSFEPDAYSFFVEMGLATSSEYREVSYESGRVDYDTLVSSGFVAPDRMSYDIPWNPAVGGPWHVPEPTSGLLSLVGLAVVLLRRRRLV